MKLNQIVLFLIVLLSNQISAQDTSVVILNAEQKEQSTFSKLKEPLIISTTLFVFGAIAETKNDHFNNREIRETRNESFSNFRTNFDDYLQYTPTVGTYTAKLLGAKTKNDFANQTALLIKSEILMMAIVFPLKGLTRVTRPDGSSKNSFPSGHTAQAFVAATFMAIELGETSKWYCIGAYSAASAVGVLRVLNNRHFTSDVLVGAGIGLLATHVVYATHKFKWGKGKNREMTFMPTIYQDQLGFHFSVRL